MLVPAGAVGAVGVPVNDGDAIVALNNMSAVFAVMLEVLDAILFDNEIVSLPILELNIIDVSEIFNLVFILFDKVIVSLKL